MIRKIINVLWVLLAVALIAIVVVFVSISKGWIGYMPPVEELENPNYKFATEVFSEDGKVLGTFSMEKNNRVYSSYADLSPNIIHALIATEDVRFAEHSGIDAKALFRAIVKRGLLLQKSAGGGSTISQQLAKQLFTEKVASNTMQRLLQKPIEWVIAVKLERYYTKEEILTMYLNKFDFLNNAVGIKTAASTYFGCEPKDLKIEQAAMLVGMCQNPSRYNPVSRNPKIRENALGRRNVVLRQMEKAGYISDAECDSLQALPLKLAYTRVDHKEGLATYFREYLRGVMTAKKPVKSEYRGEVSGIIHDVSSTGATVFVEPQAVVEANARILQYRAQEAQEIERILVAFTAQVAAIEPQFQYSYKAMLEIDVLLAKARLALDMKAFKPSVRTDSSFSLIRARHPLIDPKKCVPVDIALGKEYDSLIITGPNTGGKTVTLKTAGLLCAMAQCGFLIPADERSEICVFDEFLVDIGDEQSIEQSLSTFSGHMKKITGILELAMPHTLVLLDELGAGTDPAEGAALAVAIIEELRRRGVLLMATTHYAELKVFALETKGVVNASCEFDLETLRPTYKLSVGVPGKSNAFLISEKLGIPERVIEAAQQHLSAEDKRLDAVLGQLDDLKLQLKESQDKVEELKNEASHQLEAAQKKRDELIQQGENELEAARAKARALAQQVESKAYALTDELRQLQKDERLSTQQKAQRAREIAKKESEKLFIGTEVVHNPVKEFVPLKEVKVGQEVCIAELNQLATVLALPDKNGDVLVRAGIIKTKVPLKGLKQPDKLIKEPQPKTKAQQRYSRLTGDANRPNGRVERVQRSAKMELNLLGLTVDEALPEVDAYIDRAILNGQTVVYLIHGNGTGALRTAIHKHLRGNRMVKSFRLGRYGEGESGVTVVELK